MEALYIEVKPEEFVVDDIVLQKDVENVIDPDSEDEGFEKLVNSICPSIKSEKIIRTACRF